MIELKDYGAEPAVLDIEAYTLGNENFRTALWTGTNLQVTLMTIPVGGEVGLELHPDIDQFLRIEEGEAKVMMGDSKEDLDYVRTAKADHAVFVPAGKWHNLVNVIIQVINHLHVNAIAFYSTCKGNKTGTKSII